MARRATGYVQEKPRSGGRIAFIARFSAYGERRSINLGTDDVISREEAEAELRIILKKVEDGTWVPPETERDQAHARRRTVRDATDAFYKARMSSGIKKKTLDEYAWRISYIDYCLGAIQLNDLTRDDIVEFRDKWLADERLSPKSVNSFIQMLAAALEEEVERGTIDRNVAKSRGLTVKNENKAKSRPYIDYDQLTCLLDAASEIEEKAREQYRTGRRALIATYFLGGLRNEEACRLTWGDWDQRAGILRVGESKTEAGIREVVVLRMLEEELSAWKKIAANTSHDAPMFPNANGGHRNKDNVCRRVFSDQLQATAERIYRERHGQEHRAMPDGISAQDGRRTFISWSIEADHNPAFVQKQVGHADPKMTLGVYTRVSDRKPDERIKRAMQRCD